MEKDFVLMVCTETYFRRVRDDEESGKGLGVRWEGRLILPGSLSFLKNYAVCLLRHRLFSQEAELLEFRAKAILAKKT